MCFCHPPPPQSKKFKASLPVSCILHANHPVSSTTVSMLSTEAFKWHTQNAQNIQTPCHLNLFSFNDVVFFLQSFHPTTGHMRGLVIQTNVFLVLLLFILFICCCCCYLLHQTSTSPAHMVFQFSNSMWKMWPSHPDKFPECIGTVPHPHFIHSKCKVRHVTLSLTG